ncbi:DUF6571 family protein [Streptomyces sp. MST-110588]|uniref:DUF6571 family protein n=1 Tax=Streptomyces sp. MST-110588 TaxID=2833628 RepID=UPI001F5C4F2E|nr:DUF6571 family protein [Streptomyces sp. MST-110588]UNO40500.1 hypothetical protein KGS77_14100 [Streptomyces sp. MST-110588]
MQQGGSYSPQFLHDMADDIRAAEDRSKGGNPDVWDLDGDFSGKHDDWFANDPLDGVLNLMSRNPGAATAYLDPDSDPNPLDGKPEKNDRLDYLLNKRDWKVVDTVAWHGDLQYAGPDIEDRDNRAGLGRALQAAATGIAADNTERHAYVPHTAAHDRIFDYAFEYAAKKENDFPPALREPMAGVLANYGDKVHRSTSSLDITDDPLPQKKLLEVMKQVSRDKNAYGILNEGLGYETLRVVSDPDPKDDRAPLIRAGRTIGFLEEARTQAIEADKKDLSGQKMGTYHMLGAPVTLIPVLGDAAQRGVDFLTTACM